LGGYPIARTENSLVIWELRKNYARRGETGEKTHGPLMGPIHTSQVAGKGAYGGRGEYGDLLLCR